MGKSSGHGVGYPQPAPAHDPAAAATKCRIFRNATYESSVVPPMAAPIRLSPRKRHGAAPKPKTQFARERRPPNTPEIDSDPAHTLKEMKMKTNLKPLAGSILLLFASAAVAAPANWAVSSAAKTVTAPAPKVSIARPGENAALGTAVLTRIENITATAGSGKNVPLPGIQGNKRIPSPSGGKPPLGPLGSDKTSAASNGTAQTPSGVSLPGQAPSSGSNNTLGNTLGLPSAFRDPRGDPAKNKPNKTAQQSSGWSYSDAMTDKMDSNDNQDIVRVEHYEDNNHRMTITSTAKNGKETQDIVYVDKKTGKTTKEKNDTPAEKPKDPTPPPPPEKPKDPPPPPPETEPSDGQKTPLPDGVDGGGRGYHTVTKQDQLNTGASIRQSMSNPGHADIRAYNSGLMQNPVVSRDPKARLTPWIMPTEDGSSGKSSPIPVPASGNSPRVNLGASLKDPGPLGDFTGGFAGSATSGTTPR
jgi:hypothetical protein